MEWQAVQIRPCQLILIILVLIQSTCIHYNPIEATSEVTRRTLIQMPKIHIDKPDSYICMAVPVTDIEFSTVGIVRWAMVTFVQEGPLCLEAEMGEGSINHSGTVFPEDVCIQLGKDVKLNYVVIQTHFKEAVPDPDALKSNPTNVTLFLTEERLSDALFTTFRYIMMELTSTDRMQFLVIIYGQLIEGYIVRNNTKILLAMDKPKGKSHDTVQIEGTHIEIRPGDILAVRCSYRNTGSSMIQFRLGFFDEMCNLELSFKNDAKKLDAFPQSVKCVSDAQDTVWCPNGAYDQVDLICDLHHETTNKVALEDIFKLFM